MMRQLFFILSLCLVSTVALARDVELSWDALEGATKYEIQISNDDKFLKPLQSAQLDKPSFATQLTIGAYFYRVRVIDKKGRPGRWSAPSQLGVTPYPPELLDPKSGYETSYYEVNPEIDFSWKAVDGKPDFEILVYKTTGQKVLEEITNDTHLKTSKIGEGEFLWKIRSIANKTLVSPYCEPRRFTIVKKTLTPPELITPAKDGVSAAYRPVNFTWKQDPNTKFTDIYFEKIKGREGAKLFKNKVLNLSGSSYKAEYEEPGKYRWHVTTKEAKDTPGVSAPEQEFDVGDDIIAAGNYELEFSMSLVGDLYTTTSARQTQGLLPIAQESSSSGTFYGFLGGYYIFEEVGLFLSTRTGNMTVENFSGLEQETDLTLRVRFGTRGFNQEFWLGYRTMDIIEAENTPVASATDFNAAGALVGTRFTATVVDGWRAQLTGFYFKPTTNTDGISGLVADAYGLSLGVKWNFMYQFWAGYRFSTERIVGTFGTPNMGPSVNSTWTMYRTEPVYLSISFEH